MTAPVSALLSSASPEMGERTFPSVGCPQIGVGRAREAVAAWMLAEIERDGLLWQCDAVDGIRSRFGDACVYENDRGHLAITGEVLTAFRDLTGDRVVWSCGGKFWRLRTDDDEPGRSQR